MLAETTITVISVWSAMNSWLTPTVLFFLLNIMIGTIAITSGITTATPSHHEDTEFNRQQKTTYSSSFSPAAAAGRLMSCSSNVLHRLKSINYFYRPDHDELKPSSIATTAIAVEDQIEKQKMEKINIGVGPVAERVTVVDETEVHGAGRREEEEVDEGCDKDDDTIKDEYPSMDEIFRRIQERKVNNNNNNVTEFGQSNSSDKQKQQQQQHQKVKKTTKKKKNNIIPKAPPLTVKKAKVVTVVEEEEAVVDAKADDFINKFRQQLHLQRLQSLVAAGNVAN